MTPTAASETYAANRELPFLAAVSVGVAVILIGLAQFIRLAGRDIEASGKPLTINPSWSLLGAVILLASVLAAGRYLSPSNQRRRPIAASIMFGLVAGLGLLIVSTYPGRGIVIERDTILPLPPDVPKRLFAAAVLFDNGSDRLSPTQRTNLRSTLAVFDGCRGAALRVRGFASSAPFKSDSDRSNMRLANRRSQVVAGIVKASGIEPTVVVWNSPAEMAAQRRIVDFFPDSTRDLGREIWNRRVELIWEDSPCRP